MNAQANTVAVAKKDNTFPVMLEQYKGEIARALPKHMNADRMLRIALTEFRKSPKLAKCDPRSVFASIIIASQLGIEPGIGGQGFLVPYKGECQFIPGWKGLVDLVSRAGRASVWTGAVFVGDDIDYELGDRPFIKHKPGDEFDESKITHVYAVGRVRGAEYPVIEVWPMKKVGAHLEKYNKVGDSHYAYENKEMYGRKVALLQVLKYMPQSVELQQAIELEYAGMKGKQNIDIKDAVDGTWVANTEDDGDKSGTDASRSESLKDRLRTESGNAGASNGDGPYKAKYATDGDAITALKQGADERVTAEIWKDIVADFKATNRPMHVSIEAAKNDHMAALQVKKL